MAVPRSTPHDYVPLFAVERRRLIELLGGLSSDDWKRPTPCPGWTVLDLTNHLVGGDLSLISRHRDAHHGTPAPKGLAESDFIVWLNQLQDDWVRAARRISPQLTVGFLDSLVEPLVDSLRRQTDQTDLARVSWAGTEPVPVWLDHGRELSERWIHRQQLLEALGRGSDLRRDLVGPILDALRWCYPHRLNEAQLACHVAEVEITGSETIRWTMLRSEDGWGFANGDDTDRVRPDGSISLSVEQVWRLLTNNFRSVDHGAISSSGDAELVDILLRARAIIGTPKLD